MREFSAQQLKAHLDTCDEQPLLIDVRQPWEFDVCKIEDSVLIPMSRIPAEAQSLDAEREIVVICHHGIRSQQVIRYLLAQTAAQLINLDGGVDAWAREVDSAMPVY